MERGGPPRGLRRRRRGAGGAPRQGLRAGDAAAGGGAGLPRQGAVRQGGRGGHAGARGGRRQAQGAAGNNGGQRARPRARLQVPGIQIWWANVKYANPKGLSLQDFEREVDTVLTGNPRVNQKELDVYRVDGAWLAQGPDVAMVLNQVNDGYRKIALTRKILMCLYLNGKHDSVEAKYWRKEIYRQIDDVEVPLDELVKSKKDHRGMPGLFASLPELLPKEKKPSERKVKKQ